MYAVQMPAIDHLAFFVDDPREGGCDGAVIESVSLDFPDGVESLDELYLWPKGADAPETCLGRDSTAPSRYRVFRSSDECRREGFVPFGPNFSVHGSWVEVAGLLNTP
jgi:hypothetical protein